MIKWGKDLWLFTKEEFALLPDGIELEGIGGPTLNGSDGRRGRKVIKGKDDVNMDTRYGYIAFGVRDPLNHPCAELFTTFILKNDI